MYNMSTMSFAIVETGGKQYTVAKGDIISVEKLKGDHKVGDKITLSTVVLKDDGKETIVGTPYVKGGEVTATIAESGKLDKVMVVRYRAKSRYHKRNGHRQPYMALKIESIK